MSVVSIYYTECIQEDQGLSFLISAVFIAEFNLKSKHNQSLFFFSQVMPFNKKN